MAKMSFFISSLKEVWTIAKCFVKIIMELFWVYLSIAYNTKAALGINVTFLPHSQQE